MRDKLLYGIISLLMAAGLLVAVPAFAQSQGSTGGPGNWGGARGEMGHGVPGVFGSVTAVSGATITLTSKGFGKAATSTTIYSVDASAATVIKNGATSTVSAIATGDNLMVQGTVSGTNVAATRINDGMPQGMGMPGQRGAMASSTPRAFPIQGNGEPVVGGSVASVSGNILSITNKSNTYTVDASNATVIVKNATSSIGNISAGDNVLVQGTVNGTAVTASSVIDQGQAPSASANGDKGPMPHGIGGIVGAIGGFLQHLFGFF